METAKKRKNYVRTGLILVLVWLLVASLVIFASSATSGSGKTAGEEFTWSWKTDNEKENAAGTFSGSVVPTTDPEFPNSMTLTLDISATSSTYVEEEKNGCGMVTQEQADAENTTTRATVTFNIESTIVIKNVDVGNATCSLSNEDMLTHGDSFTVSITANRVGTSDLNPQNNSESVKIIYSVVENVEVVYYGADGASYTTNGATLDSVSESTSDSVTPGSTITLPAAPTVNSGTTFKGWRTSHDGSLYPEGAGVTIKTNTSIYPVIIADGLVAPFTVGETAYEFWTDAAVAAGDSGTIVLNQNYTLPTTMAANGVSPVGGKYVTGVDGNVNYIVPTGVTLLIPFDDANTLYTTEPGYTEINTAYVQPTAYRTLTIASGTKISVDGAISVSGKHRSVQGSSAYNKYGGAPIGKVGFINMEGTSSIEVNNGGALYAYGFITGSGSVTAKSGATIYELFQITDYRGGDQSTKMKNAVFPVSQYYVQNIEVPLTLYSGAKEYGYTTVYATRLYLDSAVNFIGGSESMFNIQSGYVTKEYDGSTDRLLIEVNGEVSLSSVELTLAFGQGINSAEFVLPLNGNITITVKSGSTATVAQDLAFIPGSQMIVEENATVTLASGKSVYIYDSDTWGKYCYVDKQFGAVPYAPGRTHTRTAADLVDASILVNGTIDASAGYVYTTSGGANIHSTHTGVVKLSAGTAEITYQFLQSSSTYDEITVDPAYLKNGDGSYVQSITGTYTYCTECNRWHICGHATNVELGNSLNMFFAFWDTATLDNKDWSNYYVEIIHKDADGNVVKSVTLSKSENQWLGTTVNNVPAQVVRYDGLAAKQMGDIITVKLYLAGVTDPIDMWSNSIQNYAMRMLTDHSDNETLRTLLVDMLNYGAACQTQFNYNTTNLVNADLSAEQKSWETSTVAWSESESMPSGNANFEANLVTDGNIRFAFNGADANASYTFNNHWGADRGGNLLYDAEEDYYYISKLYVADAKQVITITVGETTWTDSIEAYCWRMVKAGEDTNGVFTAFMKFADSSEAYLEGGSRL